MDYLFPTIIIAIILLGLFSVMVIAVIDAGKTERFKMQLKHKDKEKGD